jgi:beta-glucosidase-like glycosyl hydrolase
MGAVPHGHEPQAAVQAIAAGADILLVGRDKHVPDALIVEVIERVIYAVQSGSIAERRLDASIARISAQKARYPGQL